MIHRLERGAAPSGSGPAEIPSAAVAELDFAGEDSLIVRVGGRSRRIAGRPLPGSVETSASGGAPAGWEPSGTGGGSGTSGSRCVSLDAAGIEQSRPIDGCTGSLYAPTCSGTGSIVPGPGTPSTCPGRPFDLYYPSRCTCDKVTGLVNAPVTRAPTMVVRANQTVKTERYSAASRDATALLLTRRSAKPVSGPARRGQPKQADAAFSSRRGADTRSCP